MERKLAISKIWDAVVNIVTDFTDLPHSDQAELLSEVAETIKKDKAKWDEFCANY